MSKKWDIANRIKEERERLPYENGKCISQGMLADKINDMNGSKITYKTVSGWENGKPIMKREQERALCEIFQCDIQYLLCETDQRRVADISISERIGLTKKSVDSLITANRNNRETGKIISAIIENDTLISLIDHYINSNYGDISSIVNIKDALSGKDHSIIVSPEKIRKSERLDIAATLFQILDALRLQ